MLQDTKDKKEDEKVKLNYAGHSGRLILTRVGEETGFKQCCGRYYNCVRQEEPDGDDREVYVAVREYIVQRVTRFARKHSKKAPCDRDIRIGIGEPLICAVTNSRLGLGECPRECFFVASVCLHQAASM